MFFKKKNDKKNQFQSIDIAICTLLIHAARTDQKFDKQEKKLIEEYLLISGKSEKYINQLFQRK